MAPSPMGTYKVCESIRNMWDDLSTRPKVIQLFEKCNFSPDTFVKRFSISSTKEKEEEVNIPFEFVSEEEMANDYDMSANLG